MFNLYGLFKLADIDEILSESMYGTMEVQTNLCYRRPWTFIALYHKN